MVIINVHLQDDGSYRFELQAGDPGPDITKELVAIAMAHQSKCYRVPAIDPNNGAAINYLGGMSGARCTPEYRPLRDKVNVARRPF